MWDAFRGLGTRALDSRTPPSLRHTVSANTEDRSENYVRKTIPHTIRSSLWAWVIRYYFFKEMFCDSFSQWLRVRGFAKNGSSVQCRSGRECGNTLILTHGSQVLCWVLHRPQGEARSIPTLRNSRLVTDSILILKRMHKGNSWWDHLCWARDGRLRGRMPS